MPGDVARYAPELMRGGRQRRYVRCSKMNSMLVQTEATVIENLILGVFSSFRSSSSRFFSPTGSRNTGICTTCDPCTRSRGGSTGVIRCVVRGIGYKRCSSTAMMVQRRRTRMRKRCSSIGAPMRANAFGERFERVGVGHVACMHA